MSKNVNQELFKWFNLEIYDRGYLYSLEIEKWFRLLDIREYFFHLLRSELDFRYWKIYKSFLNNPLELKFCADTNYKTYYGKSRMEEYFDIKVQKSSIKKISAFDVKSFCNTSSNASILKEMINESVIFNFQDDFVGNSVSEYALKEFRTPYYNQGIRYTKIDINHSRQQLINDFTKFIDNEIKISSTKQRKNKHGFTDRYKNKLISFKVLPLLDLLIFRDVYELSITNTEIYSMLFTEVEALDKGREAKALALQSISKQNMLWLASLL